MSEHEKQPRPPPGARDARCRATAWRCSSFLRRFRVLRRGRRMAGEEAFRGAHSGTPPRRRSRPARSRRSAGAHLARDPPRPCWPSGRKDRSRRVRGVRASPWIRRGGLSTPRISTDGRVRRSDAARRLALEWKVSDCIPSPVWPRTDGSVLVVQQGEIGRYDGMTGEGSAPHPRGGAFQRLAARPSGFAAFGVVRGHTASCS